MRATSLAATGGPTIAQDGTNFRGRYVFTSTRTGNKGWRSAGLTTPIAANTRPYYAAVCRNRTLVTVGGSDITAFAVGGGAGGVEDQWRIVWDSIAGGQSNYTFLRRYGGGNQRASSANIQDTNPHFFELTIRVTGLFMWMDGTLIASNANPGTENPLLSGVTYGSIGGLASAANNFSDTCLGFYLWCTSEPSAGERNSLLEWSRAYWGTP